MKFNLASVAPLVSSREATKPARIFDNVGIVGTAGTTAAIIETSKGLILFDCLWPNKVFVDIIENGMHELGYNPADVKIVLISHGHPDHSGCAKHFIDKYGAVPYMSKVDYEFEPVFCEKANNSDWYIDFSVDHFIEGGETLTLGDTTIRAFSTPGHTPGGLSFLIPVYDQGRPHMAAVWGGSAPAALVKDCETYIKSLDYFIQQCKKYGVDAEFCMHPILNNGIERMQVMINRIDQVANPFVIGLDAYIRLTELFRQWAEDSIKAGGFDAIALVGKK